MLLSQVRTFVRGADSAALASLETMKAVSVFDFMLKNFSYCPNIPKKMFRRFLTNTMTEKLEQARRRECNDAKKVEKHVKQKLKKTKRPKTKKTQTKTKKKPKTKTKMEQNNFHVEDDELLSDYEWKEDLFEDAGENPTETRVLRRGKYIQPLLELMQVIPEGSDLGANGLFSVFSNTLIVHACKCIHRQVHSQCCAD